MNFTTHVAFGVLIAAVFYGKPEIILLVALGSTIPDLDREYGFLSRDSFRRHQVHRSLLHNFLFLGLLYVVNPFLCLGAFLHTLLDAVTTARDRGVEWLYPFSRLVTKAVYDSNGNRMKLDPKTRIYFNQMEPSNLTKKTTPDLKPDGPPQPWRRTYGPALSGRLLDEGIFLGSAALSLLLLALSVLGVRNFIDYSYHPISASFTLPVLIAIAGGFINFAAGEIDRRREDRAVDRHRFELHYKIAFTVSLVLVFFALFLGAIMNPQVVLSRTEDAPYILAGAGVVLVSAFAVSWNARSRAGRSESDERKEPPIV